MSSLVSKLGSHFFTHILALGNASKCCCAMGVAVGWHFPNLLPLHALKMSHHASGPHVSTSGPSLCSDLQLSRLCAIEGRITVCLCFCSVPLMHRSLWAT